MLQLELTTALLTPHHAPTNMNASSASQKSTLTWIVPRGLKRDPQEDRPLAASTHKETITYYSYP